MSGWEIYALPILISLSHQSVNPSRDVRHNAITCFQRILMSPQILQGGGPSDIEVVFHRAVFPLVQDLLDPEVYARDALPGGMAETRLRASAIICRGFLYYLDPLSTESETLTKLWLEVLDLLEELMKAEKKGPLVSHPHLYQPSINPLTWDPQYEAVPESLKNVLLVMQASGILLSPRTPDERPKDVQKRWQVTSERLEQFLPGFLSEIIPEELNQLPATSEVPTEEAPEK